MAAEAQAAGRPSDEALELDAALARELGVEFSVVGGGCGGSNRKSRAKTYGTFREPAEAIDFVLELGSPLLPVGVGGSVYWHPGEPQVVNSEAVRREGEEARRRREKPSTSP